MTNWRNRRSARLWRWPIALALLTSLGLLSALLGESGLWWWLSWSALSVPLVVIVHLVRRAVWRRDARVSSI